MNDEVEINFRNIHNTLYGIYSHNTPYTLDEKWYNSIYLLSYSVRSLNKCGIEVDYSNRNKIIHNYE